MEFGIVHFAGSPLVTNASSLFRNPVGLCLEGKEEGTFIYNPIFFLSFLLSKWERETVRVKEMSCGTPG